MKRRLIKRLRTLRSYTPASIAYQVAYVDLWLAIRRWLDPLLVEVGLPMHAPGYSKRLGFYSRLVHEGDLCFDIGANLGDRTEVFVALGATTVAVEPQPKIVRRLRKKFRKNSRVIVVPKAVGDEEGEAEMMVSDRHTLSSLSREWVDAVKDGRVLGGHTWDARIAVPVTTMDTLIDEYGKPAFCKIDVEGFEFQVLSTLSEPISAVSYEYHPEYADAGITCARHLSVIGMNLFNYSVGESMSFALPKWVAAEDICAIMKCLADTTPSVYSDVYAMSQDGYTRYTNQRSKRD